MTFGGLAAPVHGNWTGTLLRVEMPALPPGTADVEVTVVTSDGRTATLPNAFKFDGSPEHA